MDSSPAAPPPAEIWKRLCELRDTERVRREGGSPSKSPEGGWLPLAKSVSAGKHTPELGDDGAHFTPLSVSPANAGSNAPPPPVLKRYRKYCAE